MANANKQTEGQTDGWNEYWNDDTQPPMRKSQPAPARNSAAPIVVNHDKWLKAGEQQLNRRLWEETSKPGKFRMLSKEEIAEIEARRKAARHGGAK